MFGRCFDCTDCDVGISTGWNHHGPSVTCICGDCGALMSFKSNENEFGAKDGEYLTLNLFVPELEEDCWQSTGRGFKVIGGGLDEDYGIIYEFEDAHCPKCNSVSLIFKPEDGMQCPSCKTGKLNESGSAIY